MDGTLVGPYRTKKAYYGALFNIIMIYPAQGNFSTFEALSDGQQFHSKLQQPAELNTFLHDIILGKDLNKYIEDIGK